MNQLENTSSLKKKINTDSLVQIAIYLSGVKDGKGNLLPLGTIVLQDLWNAIKYLRGESGYICPERIEEEFLNYIRSQRKAFAEIAYKYDPKKYLKLRTVIDDLLIAYDQMYELLK